MKGLSSTWRYRIFGEEFGPVPFEVLQGLVTSGSLTETDEVAPDGGDWTPASMFPLLWESPTASLDAPLNAELNQLLEQLGSSSSGTSDQSSAPEVTRLAAGDEWFARVLGEELGPFGWDELCALAARGELSPGDEVRRGPAGAWEQAATVSGLFDVAAAMTQADPAAHRMQATWYYEIAGTVRGPAPFEQLAALVREGALDARSRVREGAQQPWVRAATIPGLFAELAASHTWTGPADLAAHHAPAAVGRVATAEPATAAGDGTPPIQPASATDTASGLKATRKESSRSAPARERRSGHHDLSPRPIGDQGPPQPSSAPLPLATPAAPSAPPVVGGASASYSAAAGQAAASPHHRDAPLPRSRSGGRLPGSVLNFSRLLAALKDFGGGGGAPRGSGIQLLGLVAVLALILGWRLLPGVLFGTPGATEFAVLESVWQEVLQLEAKQAPDEDWSALASRSLPILDELQHKLAPVVARHGVRAPLAQRLLWMVDTSSGPTKASGYLRQILESSGTDRQARLREADRIMSEAATLAALK